MINASTIIIGGAQCEWGVREAGHSNFLLENVIN